MVLLETLLVITFISGLIGRWYLYYVLRARGAAPSYIQATLPLYLPTLCRGENADLSRFAWLTEGTFWLGLLAFGAVDSLTGH